MTTLTTAEEGQLVGLLICRAQNWSDPARRARDLKDARVLMGNLQYTAEQITHPGRERSEDGYYVHDESQYTQKVIKRLHEDLLQAKIAKRIEQADNYDVVSITRREERAGAELTVTVTIIFDLKELE